MVREKTSTVEVSLYTVHTTGSIVLHVQDNQHLEVTMIQKCDL